MNSGLAHLAGFGGSLPGLTLQALGQILVVVCLCFDMVRALSVPRSHRRYVAATAFRTLALPSILATAVNVLVDAASMVWSDVTFGVFVMVMLIFRWHHAKDEDNWWTGKGTKLLKWARGVLGPRLTPAPAAA
ncbi:hypothetical protein [Arthrobacter sp. ISL-30]|uniref:hypothetical protein n=1 Tax=Arthrobacter sp. ISL-30 TaxID=2819109 RepID=UPI001BEC7677|nr:hypothetical protein [Arthrobacter sp. ISL-30]MBT2512560.1 hypothetical protein [Arthrobacter sp. ISL-30]